MEKGADGAIEGHLYKASVSKAEPAVVVDIDDDNGKDADAGKSSMLGFISSMMMTMTCR